MAVEIVVSDTNESPDRPNLYYIIEKVIMSLPHLSPRIADASRHEKILSFLDLCLESDPNILPFMTDKLNAFMYISEALKHTDDRVKSLSARLFANIVQRACRLEHVGESADDLRSSILCVILDVLCKIKEQTISNVLLFGYVECILTLLRCDDMIPIIAERESLASSMISCLDHQNMYLVKSISRFLGVIASFASSVNAASTPKTSNDILIARNVLYTRVFNNDNRQDFMKRIKLANAEKSLFKSALLDVFWNAVNDSGGICFLSDKQWLQILLNLSIDSDTFIRKRSMEVIHKFITTGDSSSSHCKFIQSFITEQLSKPNTLQFYENPIKCFWLFDTFWHLLVLLASITPGTSFTLTLKLLTQAADDINSDSMIFTPESLRWKQDGLFPWAAENVMDVLIVMFKVNDRVRSCRVSCIRGILSSLKQLLSLQNRFPGHQSGLVDDTYSLDALLHIARDQRSHHDIFMPCLDLVLAWPWPYTTRNASRILWTFKRTDFLSQRKNAAQLMTRILVRLGKTKFIESENPSPSLSDQITDILGHLLGSNSWEILDSAWDVIQKDVLSQPLPINSCIYGGLEAFSKHLFESADVSMQITGTNAVMSMVASGWFHTHLNFELPWFSTFWDSLKTVSEDALLRRQHLKSIGILLSSKNIPLRRRIQMTLSLFNEGEEDSPIMSDEKLKRYSQDVDEEVRRETVQFLTTLFSFVLQSEPASLLLLTRKLQEIFSDKIFTSLSADSDPLVLRAFVSDASSLLGLITTSLKKEEEWNEDIFQWWNRFAQSLSIIDLEQLQVLSREPNLIELEAADMLYCIQDPLDTEEDMDDSTQGAVSQSSFFCYDC